MPAAEYFANSDVAAGDLAHQRLNLRVGVPAGGALLEDQVGAHAAAGEIADPVVILGAVGVRVEVARRVVADVLEELHQEERRLDVRGAEPEVLIVAAGILVVQIDVEQLAGLPRLGDRVQEVQSGHVLVRHFRVHARPAPDGRASE